MAQRLVAIAVDSSDYSEKAFDCKHCKFLCVSLLFKWRIVFHCLSRGCRNVLVYNTGATLFSLAKS